MSASPPTHEALVTLKARIKELERQAEVLEKAGKPGIAQLQSVIEKYALTSADIDVALRLATEQKRKRGVKKGTKLKAKYRNPLNPKQTWAGRGLRPKWLLGLLRQGKKLEDFQI